MFFLTQFSCFTESLLIDKDKENNFLKESIDNNLAVPDNHIEQTNKEKILKLEIKDLNNLIEDCRVQNMNLIEKHEKDTNQVCMKVKLRTKFRKQKKIQDT